GTYDPLSGRSWGEVAATSRSQHKSQGFGAAAQRGPTPEYFAHVAGTAPRGEPFSGLDFSWRRYAGTKPLVTALEALERGFDLGDLAASIPALQRVHRELERLPDENPFKAPKLAEVERLIAACAGLYLE